MSQSEHANLTPESTIIAFVEKYVERDFQDFQAWRASLSALPTVFRALDREQTRALANELWTRFREQDIILDLLAQLNVRFPGVLGDIWSGLMARGVFRPGWLYLGAPPDVTERLLALVAQQWGGGHNNLLLALAWIGDERVQAQFQAWRERPPVWQSRLFIPAHDYAIEAGWELTPSGEKRQLYWTECYQLTRGDQEPAADGARGDDNADGADVGTCGWCGRRLRTLFDIDLSDPRVAFLIDGASVDATRLRIARCLWCSMFATTYTDIDTRGDSAWSAENGPKPAIFERVGTGEDIMPPEPDPPYAPSQLLGGACDTPFEALGRLMLDESAFSQLGGHPEWIQDAEYPICPGCDQRMRCAGQTAWEDEEGHTYVFICLPCGKAATSYQQT